LDDVGAFAAEGGFAFLLGEVWMPAGLVVEWISSEYVWLSDRLRTLDYLLPEGPEG